ncbi:jg4154 [Pararge aegeria aegeria]|uniref:Jg4154 protein n=1 Tax=Pararge aegeria aegeria TaxID=348720 RepID=A0A8S4R372_9NEOP|nr:jg4154 [Pararge aegeria aegeria]
MLELFFHFSLAFKSYLVLSDNRGTAVIYTANIQRPASSVQQCAEGGIEEATTLQRDRDVCGRAGNKIYSITRKRAASMMSRLVSSTNTLLSTLAFRLDSSLWGSWDGMHTRYRGVIS